MPHENEQYHFLEYIGKKVRDMKCRRTVSALFADIKGSILYGPRSKKTCLGGFGNNKGADQTAQLRSLISAFVISLLGSIIPQSTCYKRNFNFLAIVSACSLAVLFG